MPLPLGRRGNLRTRTETMLHRLIGPNTSIATLKEGLDLSSQRTRVIAHRVANATNDFASALNGALLGGEEVDLEQEMVALADEQIRFEAASRLLRRMYDQVRSSIQER